MTVKYEQTELAMRVCVIGASGARYFGSKRGAAQMTPTPTTAERRAIRTDAERVLAELRRIRNVLLPEADDAAVMSELVTIDSEIRAADQALRAC